MSVSPISSNIINLLTQQPVTAKPETGLSGGGFADVFTEAMNTASATDSADKLSTIDLLTGQSDDFSGLMIDAQKAEISLNLALQLRSKVLEAYKEIMGMQV